MNDNEGVFDFAKNEIKAPQYCSACGKKLKSGLYFNNKGPYGACCYKKLFSYGIYRTKRVYTIKDIKFSKNDIVCSMGLIKDCLSCVMKEVCDEYRNE